MPGTGGRINANSSTTPAIGDVIGDKYRVESLIGEGGMGAVFAAHHQLLDIEVAIKVLWPDLVENRAATDRFLREARAVARLKSEHVARVMDVGTLEGGQPYIVMELLEGEDLERRFARAGKLGVAEAVDYLLQAFEAVAHAHAAGIVHRDLKPANLFLASTPDGREILKVLDFGIAKLSALVKHDVARSGALTGEHTMLGSPSYMSPEQVRDSSVIDHRADLWALGVILYEMITGQEPFLGGSVGEIFGAILHATPRPLRELCPGAPPGLEAVVERCLAREAHDRFSDIAELARALAPFGTGAWTGHVARIEQTLARAQRWSDPATSPRMSLPTMRPVTSSIPVTSPDSKRGSERPRGALLGSEEEGPRTREAGADAPVQSSPGRRRPRLLSTALPGLVVGSLLVTIGVIAVPRLRARSPLMAAWGSASAPLAPSAPLAASAPLPMGTIPPLPPASPVALPAPGPVQPARSVPPGEASSGSEAPFGAGAPKDDPFGAGAPKDQPGTAPDAGFTAHPIVKRPPPATARPRAPSPRGLPGVLDSPD
jgi:serine/threonine-protein kinase